MSDGVRDHCNLMRFIDLSSDSSIVSSFLNTPCTLTCACVCACVYP